jgi:hypothetical protein
MIRTRLLDDKAMALGTSHWQIRMRIGEPDGHAATDYREQRPTHQ